MKVTPRWTHQHYRELPSFVFGVSEHPLPIKFLLFFEKKVLPKLDLKGYSLDAKRSLAASMTNALIVARKRGGCVGDSRDSHQPGIRQRIAVWDAIEKAGFCRKALGSELSKFQTRYMATDQPMDLRKRWQLECLVDLDLQRNTERDSATQHGLVYLHTGRINPLTGEPLPSTQQKQAIDFKHLCSPEAWGLSSGIADTYKVCILVH